MAMMDTLDACAQRMFASVDPAERRQATAQLLALTEDGSDGRTLLACMAQSSSPYTLLFASQGLVRWYKNNERWLRTQPAQQHALVVDGCGQCLRRVVAAGAPRHVVLSVMHAYARLTKLCFATEPFLTSAVEAALELRTSSRVGEPLHLAALVLLATLVSHCSRHDAARVSSYMTFAMHRHCSNNFRDVCLLDIFRAALDELATLATYNNNNNNNSDSAAAALVDDAYVAAVVELVKECLGYDFMAIRVDETEDAYSAQFPSAWKEVLFAEATAQLLWGQLAVLRYPHCATLLTGLANLCGMRRTIFATPEERLGYLDALLPHLVADVSRSGLRDDGVLPPQQQQQQPQDGGNSNGGGVNDGRFAIAHYVNTFAEACVRIVAPFGYRDLHQGTMFAPWVRALRALSLHVFAIPFGRDGSYTAATTLLQLWRGLVTSRRMYSISEAATRDLEYVTPSLVEAFFVTRVPASVNSSSGSAAAASVTHASSSDDKNDDVDDDETAYEVMQTQSEALAEVALIGSADVLRALALHLHTRVGSAILDSVTATAWLFFVTGALVRRVLPAIDGDDAMTALSEVLTFCVECANHRHDKATQGNAAGSNNNNNNSGGSNSHRYAAAAAAATTTTANSAVVERAVLFFLDHVQCMLGGSRLNDTLDGVVRRTFGSQAQLFQFVLTHTGNNMLRAAASEDDVQMLRTSLSIIRSACSDAPLSVLASLTLSLPPVVQLPLAQSPLTYKMRSDMYAVLWPLHAKTAYTYAALDTFLQPIVECMQAHLQLACELVEKAAAANSNNSNSSSSNNGVTAAATSGVLMPLYVAGFLRDLRGVAQALGGGTSCTRGVEPFADFVDWCNAHTEVLLSLLAGPAGQATMVAVSYLRFMQSLLHMNDWAGVFAYDPHSARCLRLFKQLCGAVQLIVERHVMPYDVQSLHAQVYNDNNKDSHNNNNGSAAEGAADGVTGMLDASNNGGSSNNEVYTVALKPLSLCMQCLAACLRNDFVPYGAMAYYQDDAYDTLLLGLLSVLRAFPLPVVLQYRKAAEGVADLLRAVGNEAAYVPLTRLDTPTLEYVIECALRLSEAEQTSTNALLNALYFLNFVASFIVDVKQLSGEGGGGANKDGQDGRGGVAAAAAAAGGGGAARVPVASVRNNGANTATSVLSNSSFASFSEGGGGRTAGGGGVAAGGGYDGGMSAVTPPRARSGYGPSGYILPGSGGRVTYNTPASAARGLAQTMPRCGGGSASSNGGFMHDTLDAARGGAGGGGYMSCVNAPARQAARRAMAELLEPLSGLWLRLLSAAMNVIACQDRALELSSHILFAIYDAYPPFWYEFIDGFVKTYPASKQAAVQEACSLLTNANASHEQFYPVVFTFRQKLREL